MVTTRARNKTEGEEGAPNVPAKREASEEQGAQGRGKKSRSEAGQSKGPEPKAKEEDVEPEEKTVDEQSEDAKAKGRELMAEVDTVKPGRGTLETGHVYFLYKPKVETEDPESLDDVAKCHILLLPNPTGKAATRYRLLTAGRKHLPQSRDDGKHEVEWGIISGVGSDIGELKETLGPKTYETKTRGTRHQPANRVAAQGHYILHSPESGSDIKPLEKADPDLPRDFPVYLAYSIAVPLPEDFGGVQKELDIKPTGTFLIQVKNPDAPGTNPRAPGVSSSRQEKYPPELRGLFTTKFIPANPVSLLDYQGHELLLISGRDRLPDGAEGKVKEPASEKGEQIREEEKKEDEEEVIFQEVFNELHLYKTKEDVPGLLALEGQWA